MITQNIIDECMLHKNRMTWDRQYRLNEIEIENQKISERYDVGLFDYQIQTIEEMYKNIIPYRYVRK